MAYEWKDGEVITADKLNENAVNFTKVYLGRADCGGNNFTGTTAYIMRGVLTLEDGKTLSEILDGKKVVGTYCDLTNRQGVSSATYGLTSPRVSINLPVGDPNEGKEYSLELYYADERFKDTTKLNVMMIVSNGDGDTSVNPSGLIVDCYALCI